MQIAKLSHKGQLKIPVVVSLPHIAKVGVSYQGDFTLMPAKTTRRSEDAAPWLQGAAFRRCPAWPGCKLRSRDYLLRGHLPSVAGRRR
jgi:hypothetical protein